MAIDSWNSWKFSPSKKPAIQYINIVFLWFKFLENWYLASYVYTQFEDITWKSQSET